MRYLVQVLTLSGGAQEDARAAMEDGLLQDADLTPGFVQGTSDDHGIAAMSGRGLVVRVLSTVADVPLGGTRVSRGGAFGASRSAASSFRLVPTMSLASTRLVVKLRALLTPVVRKRLENIGLEFVERMPSGDWAVIVTGSPSRIAADPAIEAVSVPTPGPASRPRAFGAARDARPLPVDSADYEALLFAETGADAVAVQLQRLGAEIHLVRARVVRFTLPRDRIADARSLTDVSSIQEMGVPRPLHDRARQLVGLPAPIGRRRDGRIGQGQIVGVADTGLDETHPDFFGRVVDVVPLGRVGDGSDPHGHGTHVAGTIVGDGSASAGELAGMAPGSSVYFQSLLDADGGLGGLPNDIKSLLQQAYDHGVRVHNNSWGVFLQARYSSIAFDFDEFVFLNPYFLPVIAAGNDGSCGPGNNSATGFVDFPSVSVPATAKNGLSVGASRSSRTALGFAAMTYGELWPEAFDNPPIADQTVSGDAACLAAFSARGPSDDMRIKPDVVAPGTDIASTKSATAPGRNFWGAYPHNPHYALMGGTSMACPIVTGIAVITRQYFLEARGHEPSAALLKAAIINGARKLAGADSLADPIGDPNYHQGFGRVDLSATVPDDGAAYRLQFVDTLARQELTFTVTGDFRSFELKTDGVGDLRMCLVWTDAPGRALQNALLLQLVLPDGVTLISNDSIPDGLRIDGTTPLGPPGATFRRDPNNNVHVLRVNDAPPGRYVVSVLADNLLSRSQGYALVVTGQVATLTEVN